MPNRPPVTAEERAAFLDMLAEGHAVTHISKTVGVGRSTLYDLRDKDDDFAEAWVNAEEAGVQYLEQVARDAAAGDLPPGKTINTTLLIFLLKAKRPEVYRDNYRVEHTGRFEPLEVKLTFDPSRNGHSEHALSVAAGNGHGG